MRSMVIEHYKRFEVERRRPLGEAAHPDGCPKLRLHGVDFAIPRRGMLIAPKFDENGGIVEIRRTPASELRASVAAGELSTRPVDSAGALTGTRDAALDGDVGSAVELVQRLARSERVRQSFVRHAFRFWMGRNEMLSDSRTLIAVDRAYTESGGSFTELLVALLTSDSFLYRRSP